MSIFAIPKFSEKLVVSTAALLALLPLDSKAVRRGKLAYGPAYAAVVGLDGCSAVVIHPKALLTAAHCGPHINQGSNPVYFSSRGTTGSIGIKEIYINPDYVKNEVTPGKIKINDDIALVILSEPIQDRVVLANIPKINDEKQLAPNETVTAVGLGMYSAMWGAYLGDGHNSDRRMASYRIAEKKASVYFLNAIDRGVGVCGGDSGGGLLRVSADGTRSELLGILTATGGACGGENQTDYAESVASHLDWIKGILQKEEITGI